VHFEHVFFDPPIRDLLFSDSWWLRTLIELAGKAANITQDTR